MIEDHGEIISVISRSPQNKVLNPFHATGTFLYHLKTSENQRFFDVFRGYRKKSLT